MRESLAFVLAEWGINEDATEVYLDHFQDWILSPVVVNEFRLLIAPRNERDLDLSILQDELEANGLSLVDLGFELADLVEGLVGQFFISAGYEPELTEVVQNGLLVAMVDRMGALEALATRQLATNEHAITELSQIRTLASEIAKGTGDTTTLLIQIRDLLTFSVHEENSLVEQQQTLKVVTEALNDTDLLPQSIDQVTHAHLLITLTAHFSLSELRTLAYKLSIDYDDLPGDSKESFARELVRYLERRGRLGELVTLGRQERPKASWPDIPTSTNTLSEPDNSVLQMILGQLNQLSNRLNNPSITLSDSELHTLTSNYCEMIVEQFERLTFRGIAPSGTPISLPLADVYVELKAVADVPEAADTYSAAERRLLFEAETISPDELAEMQIHLDSLRAQRWNEALRHGSKQFQRRSIQDTLVEQGQRGIVILGDPGSGKTTLLHYLALKAAEDQLKGGDFGKSRCPIFVPLAAYDDYLRRNADQLSIEEFLSTYYQLWHSSPGLNPMFHRELQRGTALVLLDGLDEVLDVNMRQFVAGQVQGLMRQWSPQGNQFVLTSRIVGYREAPLSGELPHVTVVDFGRSEIELFAKKWGSSYEQFLAGKDKSSPVIERRAAAETRDLLGDIRSNPSLERLAACPLLLTMLALLRRHVGKLPDRRVELYDRYTRTLIDNWEINRSAGARQKTPQRFDPHESLSHLMNLALWLQQNKPSGTARYSELERALTNICIQFEGNAAVTPKAEASGRERAAQFLRDMRHFAGLIVERGRDAFGFLHLTFQEYFVGRALARLEPEQRWTILQPVLHDPRWRESILLCAGQLGVLEQRRDVVTDLTRRILEANSLHEQLLQRDLFLAAAIVQENVGVGQEVFGSIGRRLQQLTTSGIPTLANNAWGSLARFARLGHPDSLNYLIQAVEEVRDIDPHVIAPLVAEIEGLNLRKTLLSKLNYGGLAYRQRSIRSLFLALENDRSVRAAVLARLEDQEEGVRRAAVYALTGVVATDETIRAAILARLEDQQWYVRGAAVYALTDIVATDEMVRTAILACLEDREMYVRSAAAAALTGVVATNEMVRTAVLARLEDQKEDVRSAALNALASVVATDQAVRTAVLARLEDKEKDVRSAALNSLAGVVATDQTVRAAVLARLEDQEEDVRSAAVYALTGVVDSDETVRTAVLARLEDQKEYVRSAAIKALAGVMATDQAVRAAVLAYLEGEKRTLSVSAMEATAELIPKDEHIYRIVFERLNSSLSSVRETAVNTLTGIVATDETVRVAVLARLEDQEEYVRRAAVDALTGVVATDLVVRNAVLVRLEDQEEDVRSAAVYALTDVVATDETVRAAVLARLEDQEEDVRSAAVYVLTGVMATDQTVRDAVLARLEDRKVYVRWAAVEALNGVVDSDETVRDAVLVRLEDQEEAVRSAAVEALTGVMATDQTVRAAVLARMEDQEEDVRSAAVKALTGIVTTNETVRAAVLARLEAREVYVRSTALSALTSVVATDETVRAAILARLEDQEGGVRSAAVEALAGVVATDETVRTAILARLDDREDYVRSTTVEALSSVVATDETFRAAILARLEDREDYVRSTAVEALTGVVATDETVRAAVLACLEDRKEYVRRAAVEALTGVVATDETVRAAILARLQDSSWPVRLLTAYCLIPFLSQFSDIRLVLLDWIGTYGYANLWSSRLREGDKFIESNLVRKQLSKSFASLLKDDSALFEAMLSKFDSQEPYARQGAALTFISMPGGIPSHVLPLLYALLDDGRGEDNQILRIEVAGALLNSREEALDRRAIEVLLNALDYATAPWYDERVGQDIQVEAISLLARLDPVYHDSLLFDRLRRVLLEDRSENVRNAAYKALIGLAATPSKNRTGLT